VGHIDPDNVVRVGGATGAANYAVVVLASRVRTEQKREVERAGASGGKAEMHTHIGQNHDGVLFRANAARVQRSLVEHVNAHHIPEHFETLQARSLFEIGGDLAGLSTRAEDRRRFGAMV
jgi:hypothetical protein